MILTLSVLVGDLLPGLARLLRTLLAEYDPSSVCSLFCLVSLVAGREWVEPASLCLDVGEATGFVGETIVEEREGGGGGGVALSALLV